MTVLAPAHRWTCSRCGVSVGRIDDHRIPLPKSWESGSDGDFCLSCRRSRAAEAAQAAAVGADAEVRARARRTGLIEFEVRRTPELSDSSIAKACRTSASTVAATRRRLHLGKGRRG